MSNDLKLQKVSCLEIEIALMDQFNWRVNTIVPNITNQMGMLPFETDMLVITPNGYAHGFEIKVSLADLKKDSKKRQHTSHLKGYHVESEVFFGKFKYFSYAVPKQLKDQALEIIPYFCGLWVFENYGGNKRLYEERAPKKLFDHKWSDQEIVKVNRLGCMRICSLKANILKQKQKP